MDIQGWAVRKDTGRAPRPLQTQSGFRVEVGTVYKRRHALSSVSVYD
jgi:ribosomal protein L30E